VKAAEASWQRATPNLERARAAEKAAKSELARAKQLAASGAMSSQDLDNAELKERTATEEHKAAQFAVQIAEFELEQSKAVLMQAQPRSENGNAGGRFEIRSPVNGRVLRVLQESATIATPGTRLVEIGDPANLEIEIDVLSTDAVKIQPGAKILLEHWGGDAPLLARVRLVEPSAFLKISALGVEEQRVNVIADFVDPPEKWRALGDGFRVEARIVISEGADVLQIPVGALFRDGTEWAVFVAANKRAALRRITLGRRNELQAEILAGLTEGETVIVHPGDKVRDGVPIRRRLE
jgi:HlyD family secretion protein